MNIPIWSAVLTLCAITYQSLTTTCDLTYLGVCMIFTSVYLMIILAFAMQHKLEPTLYNLVYYMFVEMCCIIYWILYVTRYKFECDTQLNMLVHLSMCLSMGFTIRIILQLISYFVPIPYLSSNVAVHRPPKK